MHYILMRIIAVHRCKPNLVLMSCTFNVNLLSLLTSGFLTVCVYNQVLIEFYFN